LKLTRTILNNEGGKMFLEISRGRFIKPIAYELSSSEKVLTIETANGIYTIQDDEENPMHDPEDKSMRHILEDIMNESKVISFWKCFYDCYWIKVNNQGVI
jgi:hypothetical protein